MFCYKCGIEIPEGAAFCHKCGTKIMSMDNTQQVVKKSQVSAGVINDVNLQESAVTPINTVQVQQQAVTSSKTGKKKSKKGLLISGVVFLAVVILVVVMAVIGGVNKNTYSNAGVNLSQTYVNEAEGISFQYPGAWVDADITEYNNRQSVIENTVVLLVNEDDQGVDSMIHITKYFAEQELIDHLFAEGKEFTELYSGVSILDTSITKLDGIDARRVAYVDRDGLYHLSYLYNINSALYILDFICHESTKDTFKRFFDAVVGSCSITTIASTDLDQNVDIYFNDIPIQELLDLGAVELVKRFGGSYSTDGNGLIAYKEIEFYMWDDETIDRITTYYPQNISINGHTVAADSDGVVSSDKVIELLGQDYEDEWLTGGYYMTYRYPEYTLSFCINKFSEVEHIVIGNPAIDRGGLSDGTVTGYQEPIDYYYELSGRYSGSVEQSVLSLSIYSSLEEGETAIGNVDISVGGIQHYYGDVIPSSKDIFYVETGTGGEVILVKSTLDGVIVLQLYVDGQWIDDYWMQEHYES